MELPPELQDLLRQRLNEFRQGYVPAINPHGGFGFSGGRDAQRWDTPNVYNPRKRWMYPPSGSMGPDQQMYYLPNHPLEFGFQNPKVSI